VTVNDFMDTMMSDPGPPCLVWLPLLHRLASVETGKYCALLFTVSKQFCHSEERLYLQYCVVVH
jgi:hypothetical protein